MTVYIACTYNICRVFIYYTVLCFTACVYSGEDENDGGIDEVDGVSQYYPTFFYNPKNGQSYHMPIFKSRNEEYTIMTQPGDSIVRQNSAPPSISCGIQRSRVLVRRESEL